ncbi:hypothetical protein C7S13_1029 [Burkholderia cepacia]|nr:hypothetical protein [Burkholderia cepacia]QOH34913.1 hypothetical protein C7S14_6690 [Burkholderia cepacia]
MPCTACRYFRSALRRVALFASLPAPVRNWTNDDIVPLPATE